MQTITVSVTSMTNLPWRPANELVEGTATGKTPADGEFRRWEFWLDAARAEAFGAGGFWRKIFVFNTPLSRGKSGLRVMVNLPRCSSMLSMLAARDNACNRLMETNKAFVAGFAANKTFSE
jgi:hypothetical protein